MSSMAAAMVALDSLTLNIVQEIHVRSFAGGDVRDAAGTAWAAE